MKIGFALETLYKFYGVERITFELAKRLSKRHDVKLITLKGYVVDKYRKLFENEGIEVVSEMERPDWIRGRIYSFTKYAEYFSSLDLDVINTHGLLFANAPWMSNIPTIRTFDGLTTSFRDFGFSGLPRWLDYIVETGMCNLLKVNDKSKVVVSVSKYAQSQYEAVFGRKSFMIYNGVDTKKFFPDSKKKNKFRDKYDFSDTDVIVGNVGRFVRQKNQKFLIKLCRDSKFKLVLVGNGELLEECENLAKKLMLEDKILFLGNITEEELACFYNGIDIYAQPSLWESFCLPIIESQSCGIPTVAFGNSAIKEVVLCGVTGFADTKRFKYYLNMMMKNDSKRNLFGKNARRFALKFDWNDITKKYEDLMVNIKDEKEK